LKKRGVLPKSHKSRKNFQGVIMTTPIISSITPDSAGINSKITINGSGFTDVTQVTFTANDGTTQTSPANGSDTALTTTVPDLPSGLGSVTVSGSDKFNFTITGDLQIIVTNETGGPITGTCLYASGLPAPNSPQAFNTYVGFDNDKNKIQTWWLNTVPRGNPEGAEDAIGSFSIMVGGVTADLNTSKATSVKVTSYTITGKGSIIPMEPTDPIYNITVKTP
jgi:IPT/TIG domain